MLKTITYQEATSINYPLCCVMMNEAHLLKILKFIVFLFIRTLGLNIPTFFTVLNVSGDALKHLKMGNCVTSNVPWESFVAV